METIRGKFDLDTTMQIVRALHALGAETHTTYDIYGETTIKVHDRTKSCETCARRNNCSRDMGVIFGFCNTGYIEEM